MVKFLKILPELLECIQELIELLREFEKKSNVKPSKTSKNETKNENI